MKREEAFGRLLSIATVMGDRVLDKGTPPISARYMEQFDRKPAKTFRRIHEELMQHAHKFGAEELHLMDMFDEIIDGLDFEGFTNESLKHEYLLYFHKQNAFFNRLVSAEEAAEKWGLSPGYVKNLAAEGKIAAKKAGKTWVIDGGQPNPKKEK